MPKAFKEIEDFEEIAAAFFAQAKMAAEYNHITIDDRYVNSLIKADITSLLGNLHRLDDAAIAQFVRRVIKSFPPEIRRNYET